MVLGILGGQTPLITGMARPNTKEAGETWVVAKRMYRLMANERLKTGVIYKLPKRNQPQMDWFPPKNIS